MTLLKFCGPKRSWNDYKADCKAIFSISVWGRMTVQMSNSKPLTHLVWGLSAALPYLSLPLGWLKSYWLQSVWRSYGAALWHWHVNYYRCCCYFWPTSTKPQTWKLCWTKTTTMTGYHTHTASNVARKVTAFPLWRAMDRLWNNNTVSVVSFVAAVMRVLLLLLLIYCCYHYYIFIQSIHQCQSVKFNEMTKLCPVLN